MTPNRLANFTAEQTRDGQSLDLCRWLSARHANPDSMMGAIDWFEKKWPLAQNLELVTKAAVAAGTTTSGTWAAPLAATRPLTNALLEFVRPKTVLGQLPCREVPFNVAVPAQTGAATVGWVGEGKPKPLSALAFASVSLGFAKIAGIVVITDELMRLSTTPAERLLRDELTAGVAQFADAAFLSTAAAVTGVSPAGLLAGVAPIASSGASFDNAVTDLNALVAAFVSGHPDMAAATFVLSPGNAMVLASSGKFPDLRVDGTPSRIAGAPAIVSAAAGDKIVLVDPRFVLLAIDGLAIDLSREASLQMDSAPAAPADAATVLVSLWQHNMTAVRAELFATWVLAKPTAVQWISGAAYTGAPA